MIEIAASDGHRFDCFVAEAQGDRRGGLVILQEIFGVTEQLKGVAARYAAEGYDVAIPALFDRQKKGAVIPFDDAPRGRALMQATDPAAAMRDVEAALDCVRGDGRVGVLGFCWGGGLAIRAAQVLDIDAAVSFYGTRLDTYMDRPLKAPVQGHWGTEDDHAAPETLARLKEALPEIEIHLYDGAGHAFANEHRPASFVPDAAATAHARAAEFLRTHVG